MAKGTYYNRLMFSPLMIQTLNEGCPGLSFGGACRKSSDPNDRFNYCLHCHVLMPHGEADSGTPSSAMIRLPEYCVTDHPGINPNHVLENLIRSQSVNRYYNTSLQHFPKRPRFIALIKSSCEEFDFSVNCFHLGTAIFDAVLSLYQMPEDRFEILAFLAIYIAAKATEMDKKIPTIERIVTMFGRKFSREDFMDWEIFVVQIFNWNLNFRTPLTFLHFFFGRGVVSTEDLGQHHSREAARKVTENIQKRAIELLEISLKNYDFYLYTSIAVAASAVAAARQMAGLRPWSHDLERLTLINLDSIGSCIAKLLAEFQNIQVEAPCAQTLLPEVPSPPVSQLSLGRTDSFTSNEMAPKTPPKHVSFSSQSTLDHDFDKVKRSSVKKGRISKKQVLEEKGDKSKVKFPLDISDFATRNFEQTDVQAKVASSKKSKGSSAEGSAPSNGKQKRAK